jgi:hypothetical protein
VDPSGPQGKAQVGPSKGPRLGHSPDDGYPSPRRSGYYDTRRDLTTRGGLDDSVATDRVPSYLLILGVAQGTIELLLPGRSPASHVNIGIWQLMERIDAGVSAAAVGVTVYEILFES